MAKRSLFVFILLFFNVNSIPYRPVLPTLSPWRGHGIIPVIHNLESFQVPYIIDALEGFKCCTVSLRHAAALESLHELTEQFGPFCAVGVSTVVSESQIREAKAAGATFISTMFNAEAMLVEAQRCELPVLCGVSTYQDARTALDMGADALKFYPSTNISPAQLSSTVHMLISDGDYTFQNTESLPTVADNFIDVYVAGSVKDADFAEYMKAGANGFALGFDCQQLPPKQIRQRLKDVSSLYSSLKL